MLGVTRAQEPSTKAVQKFVDELSVPFSVALDTRGRTLRALGIIALPPTMFIDSGGVVRRVHFGGDESRGAGQRRGDDPAAALRRPRVARA